MELDRLLTFKCASRSAADIPVVGMLAMEEGSISQILAGRAPLWEELGAENAGPGVTMGEEVVMEITGGASAEFLSLE